MFLRFVVILLFCFRFVCSCLFCLCWSAFVVLVVSCCVFLGLFLFSSLCLLEWSGRCSCFVLFGLFCLCLFLFICACFFLYLLDHCFLGNSSVLCFNVESIFVSHFGFRFLLFVFVCFLFQDAPLFISVCCLVLARITRLNFFLHLVILLFFLFVFCFAFWLPIKNLSRKIGNFETPQMQEKRTF